MIAAGPRNTTVPSICFGLMAANLGRVPLIDASGCFGSLCGLQPSMRTTSRLVASIYLGPLAQHDLKGIVAKLSAGVTSRTRPVTTADRRPKTSADVSTARQMK